MPTVSRMAVNWMTLQPHLPLSIRPPTPNSPPPHIIPCLQDLTRLEPAPLYSESGMLRWKCHSSPWFPYTKEPGMFGWKPYPSPWHPYIQIVWNVSAEAPPQVCLPWSCLSPDSAPEKACHWQLHLPKTLHAPTCGFTSRFLFVISLTSPGATQKYCTQNKPVCLLVLHQWHQVPINQELELNRGLGWVVVIIFHVVFLFLL